MQIGLIAGFGELPLIIAKDAKSRGYRVITIALKNLASPKLRGYSDIIKYFNPGKVGAIIKALKDCKVKEIIMAGKVPKDLLYKARIIPDIIGIKLLISLKDKTDSSILNAVSLELKKQGISVVDTISFSENLLTQEGVLTEKKPSKENWSDIKFGWYIAKEIGRLDIGQTIVVKDKAVIAVEAMEGTDETILRSRKYVEEGTVVIKVSKPQQDMRLDVPTVGLSTLKAMMQSRALILAIEAKKSIIIDKDQMIKEANQAGICIVGIDSKKFE